jgi:glucose-6-phosphate isomerase
MILDNDAHDLTFAMIQQACVRKLRRSHDRGADRSQERRPSKGLFFFRGNGVSTGAVNQFKEMTTATSGVIAQVSLVFVNFDQLGTAELVLSA